MFTENPLLYELFFWTGIICMCPFMFQFARALTRYLITSRINNYEVRLTILDENNNKKEVILNLNSEEAISQQIKEISEGKCYE